MKAGYHSELAMLPSLGGPIPECDSIPLSMAQRKGRPSDVDAPRTIIGWMVNELPKEFWGGFIAIVIAAFTGALYLGQIDWVKQLLGFQSKGAPSTKALEAEKNRLESQLEELRKAHDERLLKLEKGIVVGAIFLWRRRA
jgi:hypothetical protein